MPSVVPISSLDLVYTGVQVVWKSYESTHRHGADYSKSRRDLRCQEWLFQACWAAYNNRVELYRVSKSRMLADDEALVQAIEDKMVAIVGFFNQCHDVLEKYDRGANAQQAAGHVPAKLRSSQRRESALKAAMSDNARAFYTRIRLSRAEDGTLTRDGGTPQRELRFMSPDPEQNGSSGQLITALRQKRGNRMAQMHAENSPHGSSPPWASHGKNELDRLMSKLVKELQMIQRMISIPDRDPFLKIRQPGYSTPSFWSRTEFVRSELEDLHMAISDVNQKSQEWEPLALAVELREDWIESISNPKTNDDSTSITLMQIDHTEETYLGSPGHDGLILATKTSGDLQNEILHLPQEVQGVQHDTEASLGTIYLDETHHYHLQKISVPRYATVGPNLADAVISDKLTPEERLYLIYQVTLAHIYLWPIHNGYTPRSLEKYWISKNPEGNDLEKIRNMSKHQTLCVDVSFGSPIGWTKQEKSPKDHVVELGMLIYQISMGKKLSYESAAAAIKNDGKVWSLLDEVEQNGNLFMREILAICFTARREEFSDEEILSELAEALKSVIDQLEKSSARFASG